MSNIFGGPFEIEVTSGLDNTTFLIDATSVGDAFTILDHQITVVNDSGLLLDPATHTISDQLNFLASNTNAAILGQYATIADLSDATTTINGRLDTIESLDTTQNGRLDAHDTELQNHEDRIIAIENGEIGEETRISALETFVVAQPGIDSSQDTAIGNNATAITDLGLRVDTAEQSISEVTNVANQTSVGLANHLTDATAHDATQVYFLSPGGGASTRGFFLSGEGTTDSIYTPFTDTFTDTNAFKPDTTYHPIAFMNKIFVFSGDAGGSFVSVDGGLNFTALTTPWNINNLVTSAAVGEYTGSGVMALLLGMSSGEFYYTLDAVTFILDPATAFSNQIISLTWSNYAEWHFVVHNDMSGVYGFDFSGVSNFFQYTGTLPFEPTSIGYDANYGPILSSPSGTQYFSSGSYIASSLLGSTQVYFTHSGNNISGDYILIAASVTGDVYSYTLDSINGIVTDAWALIDTIVEAGTVSSLTQYDLDKYLVTFSPPANGGHQVVWFEYPFTNFHYQSSTLPAIRNLTGGCSAVYSSTLPSTIDVDINSGTVATNNTDEAIRTLSTANTEIRAAGYQTAGNIATALGPYRTAAAQDTIDSGKYSTNNPAGYQTSSDISTALTPYRTSSAQDTIDSGKYSTSNPSGYQTASDITTTLGSYRTSSAQDTIDSGKYSTSNPAGYQTASQVSSAITSGTSNIYYPVSNPDNYVKLTDANTAYYSSSNPTGFQTAANVASIISSNVPGFAYTSQLARGNIRIVDSVYGVSSPTGLQAYDTLANALVGISSGTTVFFYPGIHLISSAITPPAGISFVGADKKTTIFQSYGISSNFSIFTINAANISFQSLTFDSSTVTNGLTIKQFDIQSNNDTFFMDNCISKITGTGTTSTLYNIYNSGTAVHNTDAVFNIFELLCENIGGSSSSRCILHTPGSGSLADLHIESSQFFSSVGGCIETTGSFSPELQLTNCFVQGTLFDISQSTGVITLGKGTVLYNANSNGLPFGFFGSSTTRIHQDSGNITNGTSYLYFGVATASNNLIPYRINKPTVIFGMYVNQRLAPGGANTIVYTLMKNGVATALTCTVSGTNVTSSDTTHAVQFAANDLYAIRIVNSGGTSQDIQCQISLY